MRMTANEFERRLETSGDVMFEFADKKLTIIYLDEDGYDIAEQHTVENHARFKAPNELMRDYKINGCSLAELFDSGKANVTYME